MAGAIPAGIFVFLAAIASAGFGAGLFFLLNRGNASRLRH